MKKVNLGQTVNTLANLGVIGGLILLAIELSQNNALLRNEARFNLQSTRVEEIEQNVLNPELEEIYFKAVQGEALTTLENRRFENMMLGRFVRWEWYYEQYENGLIDEAVLPAQAWRNIFRENPLVSELWRERAELLTPQFVEWMEHNVVNQR